MVFFREWTPGAEPSFDPFAPQAFDAPLPWSPRSYDGTLIKVCWSVRVRVKWVVGEDSFAEEPFVLGGITPPLEPAP